MADAIHPGIPPEIVSDAGGVMDGAVEVRRRIHARPETGLDLPVTQALILDALDGLGLSAQAGQRCSSVVSVIEGDQSGPTTLLRADMDALEMPEDTGLEYASRVDGRMHACGHDAHVAMLLGAATILQTRRNDLRGRVILMFQPGEEGHDGAKTMIEDGLLSAHGEIDRAFAIHISSMIPSGVVACRPGTMMASADEFKIIIKGAGGHASMPHDAIDPVPVACQIVLALQTMVTRVVPAFDPAVLTITTIEAGTAQNVIPERVICGGTMRAVSDASRHLVLAGLRDVSSHVAAAHGCEATVEMQPGNYPVTINDATFANHTLTVAGALVGEKRVVRMPSPVMGAEDWSFVLNAVPGSMAFVGAAPPGVARPAPNHSNHFVIDEPAMATGIAMYTAMALSS
jgi:amidohydrolase